MAPGPSIPAAKKAVIISVLVFTALTCAGPVSAAYSCTVTANNLSFGLYSVINSANVDTTADISVDCSGNSNVRVRATVEISKGASASFNPRTMKNGASALNYNIYTTSAYNRIWGDGSGGSRTQRVNCDLRGAPTTCTGSATMYGRAPVGQNVPAGDYLDTPIVTITY